MQIAGEREEEYASSSDSSATNWSEGDQSRDGQKDATESSYSTSSSELVISKKTGKIMNANGNACNVKNETETETTDSSDDASETRESSDSNESNVYYFDTVERPKMNMNFNFNDLFFDDNEDDDVHADKSDNIGDRLICFENKIDKCICMIDEVEMHVKRLFGQLDVMELNVWLLEKKFNRYQDKMHVNSHRHHHLL